MAIIHNFQASGQISEAAVVALFCQAMDFIFKPCQAADQGLVIEEAVARTIITSRLNPHVFPAERLDFLRGLTGGPREFSQ